MYFYITFGQDHQHEIGGYVFDHDCVARIDVEDFDAAKKRAYELFNTRYSMLETVDKCDSYISIFPRGVIDIPPDLCRKPFEKTGKYFSFMLGDDDISPDGVRTFGIHASYIDTDGKLCTHYNCIEVMNDKQLRDKLTLFLSLFEY